MKRIGLLSSRVAICRTLSMLALWLVYSVASAGIISLSTPTSPDAGTVGLGVTAEKKSTFTLKNTGTSTLTISSVTSSKPKYCWRNTSRASGPKAARAAALNRGEIHGFDTQLQANGDRSG